MEVEPQDWIPQSYGAIPGAYQEAQKKGWQLEDVLCPQDLQKKVTGYYWVRRVHESLLGVLDLCVKRLGQMEMGRGSGGV